MTELERGESLVHPPGTICRWCRVGAATTIVYGWATCLACAATPKARVQGWLRTLQPGKT